MKLNGLSTGALVGIVIVTMLCVAGVGPAKAQSYGSSLGYFSSFVPLMTTIEQYFGPILPPDGLGNSFRSEFGTGLAAAQLQSAILSRKREGAEDLRIAAHLDKQPLRLDIFGNLRIWRLGLRANYWNFDSRSKMRNAGSFDLSGLILGGDVDLICQPWFTAGVQTDFYFFDPRFQGRVLYGLTNETFTLDVKGERPITIGTYARYVPPEILNFPLHVEGFFKASLNSTALTSFGARLVFRPQIYRFDIACRLLAEKTWVQYSAAPRTQLLGLDTAEEEWSLDVEYNLFGIDLAVYF
ncbi:MAG: hypothetical protein RDU20_21060 [Desulfomonilaceae bacterium]|nr:hypothetical protein [Desulfomonilaceae bacterium]